MCTTHKYHGILPINLLFLFKGLGAPKSSTVWDAKIFTLSILLASLFIYNTKNVIDTDAIVKLALVIKMGVLKLQTFS